MDRERMADILTIWEPDAYVIGERTFRDWMLDYADNVLRALEEADSRCCASCEKAKTLGFTPSRVQRKGD